MTRPLGKRQIEALADLGPQHIYIVTGAGHRSLIARGLVSDDGKGGWPELTPAGYRALADALERGQIEPLKFRCFRAHSVKPNVKP